MNGRRRRRTPATALIFVAILIGLGIEIVTGAWRNGEVLAELGAILRDRIVDDHQYWRLVSAMFLHGDGTVQGTILHLAVNLWALFQLGTLYETMFGTRRFVAIYFVTGIVASLTSMIVNGGPSVGASGAIFGLLGAFVFSVRRSPVWRHDRIARSLVMQCIFWIILNIVVTSQIPKIDNAAHIGGLVAGLLLGLLWPQPAPPPPPPAQVVIDVLPHDD
jgi:rhomboid protease GluP